VRHPPLPLLSASIAVGLVGFPFSSASVRMLSSLDSTPATACCRNEPHLEDCFAGPDMVAIPALLLQRVPVASIEVAPGHTSQSVATARREDRELERLAVRLPAVA
jgi:hypothetical protein